MDESFEKYDSENEDDPEVYEVSDDEWKDDSVKKRTNRRTSQRLRKRPKITHKEISSDSEDETEEDSDDDDRGKIRRQSRNGVNKRSKFQIKEGSRTPSPNTQLATNRMYSRRYLLPGTEIKANGFTNGGFLILKKDVQLGDRNKHLCLWRIDGKALLQKYEPFEEDGQIKHRNTSIYTGWSSLDQDLYMPVTIEIIQHQGHNMIVVLNWEKLKEMTSDSE